MSRPLCDDQPELSQMAAQRIDDLCALAHPEISIPKYDLRSLG
jgi:hypothetical protein